ncbi:hypothetical protein [Plantactinospora sonchi]|uniref:CarD C-terminal domain-containing protein n=1 Tax=Plantactinospora sonchi TaxID=1544735 RepID=A0ABU7RNJ5_9ACTN
MRYEVGQAVVCGLEGATTVRAITTKEVAGKTWTNIVLGYPFDAAEPETITQPLIDNDSLAPLSEVLGPGGVPAVLAVLAAPVPDEEPTTWGSVFDTYLTMIGGITADAGLDGAPAVLDARQVAQVLRNLTVRSQREPLDAGMTQVFGWARAILVSEVALGAGLDRRQAEAAIDEALSVHRP